MTIRHSQISPSQNHVPYSFVYANLATRNAAAGFTANDIGKLARQLDNNSLWMLTAITPSIQWVGVGSGSTGSNIFARDVVFEVDGFIQSTTVQGALVEIDNEKAPRSHTHHISSIESAPGVSLVTLLEQKADTALIGASNGIASLDQNGKLLISQVPTIAITETYVVASQSEMLALIADKGDVAIRTDVSKTFILKGTSASDLTHWEELKSPTTVVASGVPFTPAGNIAASNVQAALVELDSEKIAVAQKGVPGGVATLDPSTGLVVQMPNITATTVPFTPVGNIAASNVQAALADLDTEKIPVSQKGVPGGVATLDPSTGLVVQMPSITAATLPFTPAGNIAASNVQAALAELDTEKIPVSQKGIPGGVATLDPSTGLVVQMPSITAATLPFTPVGNIAASNVQAALAELDTEKIPVSQKGIPGGVATLDPSTGLVVQIPNFEMGGADEVAYVPQNASKWITSPAFVNQALDELANKEFDAVASAIAYVPQNANKWTTAPTIVSQALDELAARESSALAGTIAYVPQNSSDWNTTPSFVGEALDELASRKLNAAAEAVTYVPQNPNNWNTSPTHVNLALDELVAREINAVNTVYSNPVGGHTMLASATNVVEALQALATGIPENATSLSYIVGEPNNWNSNPTTVSEAIDRIAALLVLHIGGGVKIP